ncbi:unnamed protein product [Amoebophrya sp. A120]|nr:unnamed protein product [Amoebophrya sp. A120]|eukprot:GSA120T00003781001.1
MTAAGKDQDDALPLSPVVGRDILLLCRGAPTHAVVHPPDLLLPSLNVESKAAAASPARTKMSNAGRADGDESTAAKVVGEAQAVPAFFMTPKRGDAAARKLSDATPSTVASSSSTSFASLSLEDLSFSPARLEEPNTCSSSVEVLPGAVAVEDKNDTTFAPLDFDLVSARNLEQTEEASHQLLPLVAEDISQVVVESTTIRHLAEVTEMQIMQFLDCRSLAFYEVTSKDSRRLAIELWRLHSDTLDRLFTQLEAVELPDAITKKVSWKNKEKARYIRRLIAGVKRGLAERGFTTSFSEYFATHQSNIQMAVIAKRYLRWSLVRDSMVSALFYQRLQTQNFARWLHRNRHEWQRMLGQATDANEDYRLLGNILERARVVEPARNIQAAGRRLDADVPDLVREAVEAYYNHHHNENENDDGIHDDLEDIADEAQENVVNRDAGTGHD